MRKRVAWLAAIIGGLGLMLWMSVTNREGRRLIPRNAISEVQCMTKGRIWDAYHGACLHETYPRALGHLE